MSRKTLTTCGVAAALVLALGGGTTAFADDPDAPVTPAPAPAATEPDLTSVKLSTDKKNLELTGVRLTGASLVLVGDTVIKVNKKVATNVTAEKVIVKAPSLKGGSYFVAVVTPNGVDALANGFGAVPVVSKVVAFAKSATNKDVAVTGDSDKGGAHVRVLGSGFTRTESISFGKAVVSEDDFEVLSDTVIDVEVPAKAAADVYAATSPNLGKFPVTAVNSHGTGTKGYSFTYKALPTVTAGDKASSKFDVKTVKLTLTGTNLKGASVLFGKKAGTVDKTASSATKLVVTVPAGTTGTTVDIMVKTIAGTATATQKWAYAADAPATDTPWPAAAPVVTDPAPEPTEPVVTDPAPADPTDG